MATENGRSRRSGARKLTRLPPLTNDCRRSSQDAGFIADFEGETYFVAETVIPRAGAKRIPAVRGRFLEGEFDRLNGVSFVKGISGCDVRVKGVS